jgi:LytS/YehU family sensor histidine kinase
MMRYILYKSEQKLLPLNEEIYFVRNYAEVENNCYRQLTLSKKCNTAWKLL